MVNPLTDKVLVKKNKEEKKTASGIILPDSIDREFPEQGEVIAIGPKVYTLYRGQQVVFSKYGVDEIKVGEETYSIMPESNVLAIIE